MKLRAPVVVAVLAWSSFAHAYRPFDGTDAGVADTGNIELEIGPLGYLRAQHDTALVFGNGVFNFGFIPTWELVVAGKGVYGLDLAPPPRFQDGSVFLKHVLREGTLQGGRGISLAVEFGMLFPTSEQRVDEAGLHIALITSYVWPRRLVVHVNTVIERASDGQPDLFLGAILEGYGSARIRPVGELFLDRHGGDVQPSVLVGTIVTVNEHLSFDAATRLAYSSGAPLFEVRAGLTWTIAAWHPQKM
jgi:hypothetical protein